MQQEPTARVILGDARSMAEVGDESVHLVVTSPPYWQIKDYGAANQIGYGQSLHEYLFDLSRVWRECWRVLLPGWRLCINIGDQFARTSVYGRYQVIPLHSEIIAQCAAIGFDYMGAIIWRKKTTMHTSGGATIMGSFPHPPNGIVELDYEYILLFKKPGKALSTPTAIKEASRLTKEAWKEYFSGHWDLAGTRQSTHEAMFPPELPRRLIRMFSFASETILDPFLGSGTTAQVATGLGRNCIGYEIQETFLPLIEERLGTEICLHKHTGKICPVAPPAEYSPHVPDAQPPAAPTSRADQTHKVTEVTEPDSLRLENGEQVSLLGIRVDRHHAAAARDYLQTFVAGKRVRAQFETDNKDTAYLYLSNGIFINRKMIDMGLATADRRYQHRLSSKFLQAESKHKETAKPRTRK